MMIIKINVYSKLYFSIFKKFQGSNVYHFYRLLLFYNVKNSLY